MSREEQNRLPREIRVRMRDLPRHYKALQHNLETITVDDYTRAMRGSSEQQLNECVYPIERPFEILDNYVVELAGLGLEAVGLGAGDAPANLRRLEQEGAITRARCQRLIEVHRVRNEAQHEYPDVRGRILYEAAEQLVGEALGFLQDYFSWLGGHGFGKTT